MIRKFAIAFIFLALLQAQLMFAGNITARFTDLMTSNAVAGVNVSVYDSNNVLVSQTVSASDGAILIQNLNGYYILRTTHADYDNGYFTLQAAADAEIDIGDLQLVPLATLHLTVNDNESNPLNDGVVKVLQNGDIVAARLNGPSGDLKVSAGDYDVLFTAPSHLSQSFAVTLAPAQELALTSSLKPTQQDSTPEVVSVDVVLGSDTVDPGTEVALTATATYNDAHQEDVTYVAQWDADGAGTLYLPKLIATAYGTHDIKATFDGVSGSSALSVNFGTVQSLDVQSAQTSIYTGESTLLTSYLIDEYGGRMETDDVSYSATCGAVQNGAFSSGSECTATITSIYNQDSGIKDTIVVSVSEKPSESSRSSSSSSSSSFSSSSTVSENENNKPPPADENAEQPTPEEPVLKFIFPPSVYAGDTVEIQVLDEESNPFDGAVVLVERPDGITLSLVSKNGGKASFVAGFEGNYVLKSSKYAVESSGGGDNVIVVKSKFVQAIGQGSGSADSEPAAEGNDSAIVPDERYSGAEEERSMLGTLLAAFNGEVSAVDAIRATLPLWLIIGAVLFAAAIFFVVYTFLAGAANAPRRAEDIEQRDEQEAANASEPVDEAGSDRASGQAVEEAVDEEIDATGEEEKIETEIDLLKRELEGKMKRLKQLKEREMED